jgi:hypothetical protein
VCHFLLDFKGKSRVEVSFFLHGIFFSFGYVLGEAMRIRIYDCGFHSLTRPSSTRFQVYLCGCLGHSHKPIGSGVIEL